MARFLVQRLILLAPVLLGVTLVAFITLHLTPCDPVRVLLGELGQGASQEEVARLRRSLGLDDPLLTGAAVWDEVLARATFTLALPAASLAVALFGVSLPVFWLGLVLMLVFALALG